jgi:hypothetical protein
LGWRHEECEGRANAPDWLFFAVHKIFLGAIWCDLVRFGAIGGAEFKVQGSRFKVQPEVALFCHAHSFLGANRC